MPKRLMVSSIDEVSLVDAGDDPEAKLTFFKRKTTTDASGKDDRKLEKDMADFSLADLGLSDEQAEALDTHIAEVTKAAVDAIEPAPEPEGDPEDVFKGLDDEAKAAIEELRKQADENATALAAEIEKSRNAEYVEKAKPLEPLIGKADETGPVFARLAAIAADDTEIVMGWLNAAAQRTDLADLFKKIGKPEDGAMEKDAFVKQYREDYPDVSVEKARAAYWTPERIAAAREDK